MTDIMAMDRPLTVDKLANYVSEWYAEQQRQCVYTTRSRYNALLRRKTYATIKAVRALGQNVDVLMETVIRQEISKKTLK